MSDFFDSPNTKNNSDGTWSPAVINLPSLNSDDIKDAFRESYIRWIKKYTDGLDCREKKTIHPYYDRMSELIKDRFSRSFDSSMGTLFEGIIKRAAKKRGTYHRVEGRVKAAMHNIDLITKDNGTFALYELRLGCNLDGDKAEKTVYKIIGDSDSFRVSMALSDDAVVPLIGVILPDSLSHDDFAKNEGMKICAAAKDGNVQVLVFQELWELVCGNGTFPIIDEEIKKLVDKLALDYTRLKLQYA